MKVFVPISDEMIEAMDGSESPVPYQVGLRLQAQAGYVPGDAFQITCLANKFPADHPPQVQVRQQDRR